MQAPGSKRLAQAGGRKAEAAPTHQWDLRQEGGRPVPGALLVERRARAGQQPQPAAHQTLA
jgi:hypothetical protein